MGWVKRSHRQINEKSYEEGASLSPDNEWVLMNAATTNNQNNNWTEFGITSNSCLC